RPNNQEIQSVAGSLLLLVGSSAASLRRPVGSRWARHDKASRNRSAMIEKVRAIWITGFLRRSLYQEVRLTLGLCELPDAVARPLDRVGKRPGGGQLALPASPRGLEVFDEIDQAPLHPGPPGSGKTTLLLELASDLLDRADRHPAHPIPVVFP